MMRTPDSFSRKKILFYSIGLYLALLIAEIVYNIFSFISEFSAEKVHSTFFAKIKESAAFLKFDIALYLLLLVAIYLVFALINYGYVLLAREAISRTFQRKWAHLDEGLFLGLNAFFILTVYLANGVRYPNSRLAGLFSPKRGSIGLEVAVSILLAGYLAGFLWSSLRAAGKKWKWVISAFWILVLVSPLQPVYRLQSLVSPWFTKSHNTGPNVILIGLDSLTPSHTSYFGYPVPTTPRLDAFLADAVVFNNFYSPIARTFPALYSILTGQYPVTNGVRLNLMKRHHIHPGTMTLPQALRTQDGYFTAFFTDEVRFSNILPDDGFDHLGQPRMGIRDFVFGSIHDFSLTNVFFNSPLGYFVFDFLKFNRAVAPLYQSQYFTNNIIAFLRHLETREKFFLMVHFCAAHWPYASAAPYPFLFHGSPDSQTNMYDGAIRMADDQFGRLLEALKEKGLYENSLIVVLSDHGESNEGHGTTLRASDQNHAILAVKPAGPTVHKTIDGLVRSIDIAPTIFDLLPGNWTHPPFDGFSLKPLITGSGVLPELADNRVIMETEFSLDAPGGIGLALQAMIDQGINFYEFDKKGIITVKDEFFNRLVKNRQRAIQTRRWRLIWEPGVNSPRQKLKISLFDLEADPRCLKDVSPLYPEVFDQLLAVLRQFYGHELD